MLVMTAHSSGSQDLTSASPVGARSPTTSTRQVAAALLAGAVLIAILSVALWVLSGRPDLENWSDIARTAVFAFGALGVLPAGLIAFRRQQVLEQQRIDDLAKYHLSERIEQARSDEQAELNIRVKLKDLRERFTDSAAQLGNSRAAVRLAGVYALAELADEWGLIDQRQRQVCIDVLCGYLRIPVSGADLGEDPIRETIVRVISDHVHKDRSDGWHDNAFDFTDATFTSLVTFDGAAFRGPFLAEGATFVNGARFYEAEFSGRCSFSGARFTKAALFNSSTFSGSTSFTGTTFADAASFGFACFNDGASYYQAQFSKSAQFAAAKLNRVSFDSAEFGGEADFSNVEFSDCLFQHALFSGRAAFGRSGFSGLTSFDGSNFVGPVNLSGTEFSGDTRFVNISFRAEVSMESAQVTGAVTRPDGRRHVLKNAASLESILKIKPSQSEGMVPPDIDQERI